MLKSGIPAGIIIVYLGFGAGLAVFMFCGFVKADLPEMEEAALIDGRTPVQAYLKAALPILKPACTSADVLQAMWIWNDYLLPSLVLDTKR